MAEINDVAAPAERFYTVDDLCLMLGIHPETLRRWRKKGLAPKTLTLPGGVIRIAESEFKKWKKERTV